MKKLFVEKQIEINALPAIVWDVLTKKEYSDAWSYEFSGDEKFFYIESDWNLGDAVYWKKDSECVLVEGKVTVLEENKLLQFTVSDSRHPEERPILRKDDGITFEITQVNGHCILHVRHGDFGLTVNGERHMALVAAAWNRALPKIKNLAEHNLVA